MSKFFALALIVAILLLAVAVMHREAKGTPSGPTPQFGPVVVTAQMPNPLGQ